MSRFFKLLFNELMKIFVRKTTWVMYGILTVIVIAGIILTITTDQIETEYSDNWREELKQENENLAEENAEMKRGSEESGIDFGVTYFEEQINKNNYYLENDIKPLNYGAWQHVLDNAGLVSLISLFTIIIGSGIVSSEFRWGTIKLLLIRPVSRTMILASKFVAVLLFALFTLIFLWIVSFISGAIVFGFEGFNPSIVLQKAEGLVYVPLVGEVLTEYGYNLVNLVMMTTFAFMISTIFRNSSIAIGLGIFLMMGGNMVVQIFSEYDWAKFILFANTNLRQYETGNVWIDGMTLGFSITMLIIYFVVFIVLSWVFFNKRDVAGQ
ncbi:ABC transporter permease [Filobacillus milosensis]|uniref:ABC transporter permease n=1 Tax=Filobacillus milosensis TaxID=94137 RepID=A0A4Y8IJ41_9BACI|nr:ABC transporter permease [Filobacillus milosensis]TFB19606.1 ABC transporter permease [Filobacillus milosensis]